MTFGGGGGGSKPIEDTPERRKLAESGAEQWNYAQEKLAPLQNHYMDEIDNLDSAERKQYISGHANSGMQNALGNVAAGSVIEATARGVDLGSGRANGLMANGYLDSAAAGADVSARALAEQDRQKVVGLQNVVAMGSGQQTQSMAGLADISELSSSSARENAMNSFNRRSANLQALGSLAGAGTASFMNSQAPAAGSNMDLYGSNTPYLSTHNIL